MKTSFTKRYFCFAFIICIILNPEKSFSQWSDSNLLGYGVGFNDKITVTSSETSVSGTNAYQAVLVNNTNDIIVVAENGSLSNAFTTVPLANQFKATAGKPITISIEFDLVHSGAGTIFDTWIPNNTSLSGGIGKNEQNYAYDQYITIPLNSFQDAAPRRKYKYTGTYTFAVGRTRSWLVFGFQINRSGVSFYKSVIIPFVVEGPSINISQANPVAIRGYLKEPAIPQMILHNPPGDLSSVTFQTNQEACRNMSESLTTDESNLGKLDVTLGIAGSAGLFITTNFEFSVTASIGGGGGGSTMKSSGKQNCISILNSISTAVGAAPANEGSIYMGYSSDIAYGIFPNVVINTSPTLSVEKDSSVIFGVVPGSAAPFYYSKRDILNDIAQRQTIINSPDSSPKLKHEALSQIRIWQQVLEKDSININNPSAEVITQPFTMSGNTGSIASSVTQSVTTTDSYEVSHFLELTAGVSFVVKVGGSGVSGGYEFKTRRTMGASVSNTNNTSTTIAYSLQDDDTGDILRIKIIRDKTYGTPIFLLDQAISRTSCPYEGAYQRDQPSLQIVGTDQKSITIPNITLGTPASFQVKLCNTNTTEARTYKLGFLSPTNASDLLITAAGSTGSEFGSFSVPANGCRVENYDVNISRRYPTSDINFTNLEFRLYSDCDPIFKNSVFANVSFAAPPPATGVAANKTEICNGTSVTLTASCPVTTTPTWYDLSTGGFPLAIGSNVSVTPTTNITYYVGCETSDYKRNRIATNMILVGVSSPALDLTTNFTANSLQMANTTIIASNKIFSPASVIYKAGNSLTFNPGFEATNGSIFTAKIGGCN